MTQPEDDATRLAEKISDMLICDLPTDACGNLVYTSDAKSPITEIIRAHLAERDEQTPTPTEPSQLEELIANAEKLLEIANRYSVDSQGARNCHAMVQALTELKSRRAQLAPLFTLLAECRETIDGYRGLLDSAGALVVEEDALLAKLDAALGKGDADGGREWGE